MTATLKTEHDNDMIAAYDVDTELPPHCPTYLPLFKIVTEKFDEILRLLREPLNQSNYTDKNETKREKGGPSEMNKRKRHSINIVYYEMPNSRQHRRNRSMVSWRNSSFHKPTEWTTPLAYLK